MNPIKSRLQKIFGKKPQTLQEKLHINSEDLPIHLPPKTELGKVYKSKSQKTALLAALALAIITPVTAAILGQMTTTDPRSKAFQDETPVIKYLTIIDADTNQDFMVLDNTSPWQVSTPLPERLNIKAETAGFVSSVKFFINGELVRTENAPPFAIAGDTDGNFNPWRLPEGEFTLTVIAYQAPNGTGMVSEPYIVTLNLSNSNSSEIVSQMLPGDCNGDGIVDAGDINALALEIEDLDSSESSQVAGSEFPGTTSCDANGDSLVNTQDNVCIQSLIVGEVCNE